MPPWDKYKDQTDDKGPWAKYKQPSQPSASQQNGGFLSSVGDFFKSIPTGVVKGLSGTAAASGEAAQIEMGEPVTVPNAEQSQQIVEKNVTGELHKPQGKAGQYGQTIGEFFGTPTSYLGPESMLTKGAVTLGGAVGSEGAGQVAQSAGLPEAPARIIGGVIGGGGAGIAAAERAASKMDAALPTMEKIQAAGNAGYKKLRESDAKISAEGMAELKADVVASLAGFRDYLAPSTFKVIEEFPAKGNVSVDDIDSVRKLLGKVPAVNLTDREAANRAIDAIDDWLAEIPDHHVVSGEPSLDAAVLRHAQGNWAAYRKLQMFGKSEKSAEYRAASTGSGANVVNTQRQEIRKILDSDKKSRGLSAQVKDKMEDIVLGTILTNQTRKVGKFAPTGAVSAIPTMGAAVFGGAPAAGAVALGGSISKWLSEYLTQRQLNQLDRLLREDSPIGRPIAKEQESQRAANTIAPGAAAMRSGLTAAADSPLAQPGQ